MSNTNNTTKNGSTNYGTKRGGRRRGFTLIEILIVVVILGVLAALVIPGVTAALDDANKNAAIARASQITTMVTRLNTMKPSGVTIPPKLADVAKSTTNVTFTSDELSALTTKEGCAGYCSEGDLKNQKAENKGWVYNATTKKFEPES